MADISEASGWFITYPGGERQDDPASVVALPGGTPGQIGVNPGLTYVHQTGTWVPAFHWWVAPGGQVYAFQNAFGIQAVTIPDGQVTYVVTGSTWFLIGTEDDGVYATNPSPGAWFIPFGGQPRQVVDHGTWDKFFGGSLWSLSRGNLISHDVTSGLEARWTTFNGYAEIAGFDVFGDPLITHSSATPSDDANQSYDLTVVHPDGTTTTVWSGQGMRAGGAIGDANGIWFEVGGGLVGAPGHGLYLWTAAHGAQMVSPAEGHVAGPCSPVAL
jgi:hypothetical protein